MVVQTRSWRARSTNSISPYSLNDSLVQVRKPPKEVTPTPRSKNMNRKSRSTRRTNIKKKPQPIEEKSGGGGDEKSRVSKVSSRSETGATTTATTTTPVLKRRSKPRNLFLTESVSAAENNFTQSECTVQISVEAIQSQETPSPPSRRGGRISKKNSAVASASRSSLASVINRVPIHELIPQPEQSPSTPSCSSLVAKTPLRISQLLRRRGRKKVDDELPSCSRDDGEPVADWFDVIPEVCDEYKKKEKEQDEELEKFLEENNDKFVQSLSRPLCPSIFVTPAVIAPQKSANTGRVYRPRERNPCASLCSSPGQVLSNLTTSTSGRSTIRSPEMITRGTNYSRVGKRRFINSSRSSLHSSRSNFTLDESLDSSVFTTRGDPALQVTAELGSIASRQSFVQRMEDISMEDPPADDSFE